MRRDFLIFKNNKTTDFFFSFLSPPTEMKTGMMQDTPTTFTDCAAIFKSGSTQSGVYTLTIPNTTIEVKVKWPCCSKQDSHFQSGWAMWRPWMHINKHGPALTHPCLPNLVNKTMHTSVRAQSTVLCLRAGQWNKKTTTTKKTVLRPLKNKRFPMHSRDAPLGSQTFINGCRILGLKSPLP